LRTVWPPVAQRPPRPGLVAFAALGVWLRHRRAARPKGLDRSPDPSLRCGSRGARRPPLPSRRFLAPRTRS